jgi:hypothetical protein
MVWRYPRRNQFLGVGRLPYPERTPIKYGLLSACSYAFCRAIGKFSAGHGKATDAGQVRSFRFAKEITMRAGNMIPIAFAVIATVGACSQKTQEEAATAANSASSDMAASTAATMNGIDSASANASNQADPAINRAGDRIDSAVDQGADAAGNAMAKAGTALHNAGEGVKH